MCYLIYKLNTKVVRLVLSLGLLVLFNFYCANFSFAVNELREDTHIVDQDLLLGNGVNLITASPNGDALQVDSQLILDEQVEIRGGDPGLAKVLTSDANGLASWTSAGSSEWIDTGSILHPNEVIVDEIAIGGNTEAGADIFLGVDGLAVFNEQGNSVDFRIESSGQESAFFVDGSAGNVGISINNPSEKLEVNGNSMFVGNIEPSSDNGFDLGADSLRWQDLFLGPESLRIGTSGNEAVISYNTSNNQLNFDVDGDNLAEIVMDDTGNFTAESVTAPTIVATTTFSAARFRATDNGSVSLPAFSFSSDTDIGIYRPGEDQLRFAVDGADEMQIESGTVAVLNDFDVNGTSTFGNANQSTIPNTGQYRAAVGSIAIPSLSFQNDQDSGFSRAGSNDMRLSVNGTQLVRFQTSGLTISTDLIVNGVTTLNGIFIPNLGINIGVNGTAASPAYSFVNDTDTGVRREAEDDMRLVAGAADQVQIDSGMVKVINDFDADGNSSFGSSGQASIASGGQFRAGSGNVSNPSLSFENDQDSGFFRAGSNDIRFALGGVQEMRFLGSGITITNGLTLGNDLTVNNISVPNTPFLLDVNGTEMEPAYSFASDTDLGIRLAADGDARLVANGSDMLQITATKVLAFSDFDANQASTFGNANQASISNQGHFRAAAGTAASPGLSFENDQDSGFFRAGINDIRMSVNGSQLMRFRASSVTVNKELLIQANTTAEDIFAAADDTHSIGTTDLRWSELFLGTGDLHIGTSTSDEGEIFYNSVNNSLQINLGISTGNIVVNDSGADVDFIVDSNNGTSLVHVDASANNVGVGFSNPSAKLAVNGGGLFAGNILPTVDNGFNLGSNTFRWNKLFLDPSSLSIGTSGDDVVLSYDTNADIMEVNKGIEAPAIAAISGTIGPSGSFANAFILCKGGITSMSSTTFTCGDPRLSDVSSFTDEFFSVGTDTRRVICWGLGAMTDNTSASITTVNNDDNQISFVAGSWALASGTGANKIASITCTI